MYISRFSHLHGFIGLSQYQEFKLVGKKKKKSLSVKGLHVSKSSEK